MPGSGSRAALAALTFATSACQLLVDAEPFREAAGADPGDAGWPDRSDGGRSDDMGPDPGDLGPTDDGPPFNPGPARVEPESFLEGSGSVIPAVVYVVDPSLEPGDELRPPAGLVFVESRVEAGRGALAFRLPPDPSLADGVTRTLRIRHLRGGNELGRFPIEELGLPEAILDGPVDAGGLAPLYARVRLRPGFAPTGATVLRSTGPISVDASLDLSAVGMDPGPGGYAGATLGAPAEGPAPGGDGQLDGCPGAGGGAGALNTGGDGQGAGQGPGGAAVLLDAFSPPIAQLGGGGGGRGAEQAGAVAPGAGGGGGGVLVLRTTGELEGTASIAARGADGETSPRGGCSPNSVGAGGGGAGGFVVLRSRGGPIGLEVDVSGGAGGENGGRSGGSGSDGFLVVGSSTISDGLGGLRVPEWAADQPVIGERLFSLHVIGAAGELTVVPERDPISFDEGRAEIELPRGLQEACLEPRLSDLDPSCIQVAIF